MSITRLQNIYSSNTGRILYVSPDDFDASDAISNRGNSPLRPFKSLQRALLEAARFSYVPGNSGNNDRFDQFTIMLEPGDHVIDNRPGYYDSGNTPILSDVSNFNLQDPDNDLYKFNSTRGGVIVPRGTSIIGVDLRKTKIYPKFIPDPNGTDGGSLRSNYPNTGELNSGNYIIEDDTRSAIFRVTGGCYFWQFSFFDGDPNGVYTGLPNPTGVTPKLVSSTFSHHKLTNFEYACYYDLSVYYQKVTKAFSDVGIPLTDPLGQRTEENRIVGPGGIQADTTRIGSITSNNTNVATATTVLASDGVTRVAHGFSVGSQIRIFNAILDENGVSYNGTYQIVWVGSTQQDNIYDSFKYELSGIAKNPAAPINGTYLACELESDTVDSASPYIFNISIRSTYGLCGMHANGALTTGFKSMVVAQYTGICLQKDDSAFVRACGGTGATGPAYKPIYQDGTITTCGSAQLKPAHQDINSHYKKGWRNYHIKASNDGYIQVVSVFAVGFADQFVVESGGDMSIANSDSNFGNTALRAKGYKSNAFLKDQSGIITHIIPPANLPTTEQVINWLPIDIQKTRTAHFTYSINDRVYIYGAGNSAIKPVTTLLGYTIGGRTGDKIYAGIGGTECSAIISPSGIGAKVAPGQTGSPVQYDTTLNNWYLQVTYPSTIVTELWKPKYATIDSPISTYFTRINDSRISNDKIYRLRMVIPKNSPNPVEAPPQPGFIIQPAGSGTTTGTGATYNNTYYIFDVETNRTFISGEQDGVYYLTALLGNISPTSTNFNDMKYSQNINQLYPTEDIDNPVSDPTASLSLADNVTIGLVNTTNGSGNIVTDRSITREAIIKWCKEPNSGTNSTDNGGNYYNSNYRITLGTGVTLSSTTGIVETRAIKIVNDSNPYSGTAVELRRPSIIRAGNQTFEYTGFGPGNYSTGFPSRQTIVLTPDQIRLSQAQKENGGVAFYSGLNANGDLYVGNAIINPVTGTTSTVNNPTTTTGNDPNAPVYTNLTLTKGLTVIGDVDNTYASSFYGPLSISGSTTINNNIQINPTWDSGTQQTAIKLNVVDNSSSSSSNLLDLQLSGTSQFSVGKTGVLTIVKGLNVLGDTDNSYPSNFSGPVSIGGLTTIDDSIEITPTWSTLSSEQFGISLNVTDTLSQSTSKLLNLKVASSSKFNIDKFGKIAINGYISTDNSTGIKIGTNTTLNTSDYVYIENPSVSTGTTLRISAGGASLNKLFGEIIFSSSNPTNEKSGASIAALQSSRANAGNLVFTTSPGDNIDPLSLRVERMRITDIGRVGIGTAAPTSNLHVIGDIRASGQFIGNNCSLSSTQASTSYTSGALIISGGVGIGGALYVGHGITTTNISPTNINNIPTAQLLVPTGTIIYFADDTPPDGYLKANGAAVSRTTYANLFAVIGTRFGVGNGTTTFNLPDLRGEFIRGWDNGRGIDVGRVFGTGQSFAIQNITGSIGPIAEEFTSSNSTSTGALYKISNTPTSIYTPASTDRSNAGTLGFDASKSVLTSTETRPRNVALLACIKY